MSQFQKRSGRCMVFISVYGELPLPTYLDRLISTFAVAKLVHMSFTDNSKGREARLPMNCFRTRGFLDILTPVKVVSNCIHQMPNFLKKLTII